MDIKELRTSSGLSQNQFAARWGIPVRTLQQWEQGRSAPPDYVVNMIERLKLYSDRISGIDKYRLKKGRPWKVCIEDPFQECCKVHPLQQKKVAELLHELTACDAVGRVIVFGSSVTDQCHIGSDVDIYAEMTRNENPIRHAHSFEYDFWNNFTADDRLKTEILNKGVQVYG